MRSGDLNRQALSEMLCKVSPSTLPYYGCNHFIPEKGFGVDIVIVDVFSPSTLPCDAKISSSVGT